mmetsp:Transcript_64767/g.153130  ORF Transcript_64767/g.153130 Transcript_64767/m.153130 type:complete len:87 (-) Transcript_64767:450-710(-)
MSRRGTTFRMKEAAHLQLSRSTLVLGRVLVGNFLMSVEKNSHEGTAPMKFLQNPELEFVEVVQVNAANGRERRVRVRNVDKELVGQ